MDDSSDVLGEVIVPKNTLGNVDAENQTEIRKFSIFTTRNNLSNKEFLFTENGQANAGGGFMVPL